MRFKGLDLNLLVALDILLEEQNVSRTAERMHLSQSAMSGALSRLREHFRDELLISYGRRLVLTPLAEMMRPALRNLMLQTEALVEIESDFSPATSQRHFRVELPDHLVPVIFPEIIRRTHAEAPNILLEVCRPRGDPSGLLHRGELDLVITPDIYANSDYMVENLLNEIHVVIGWNENPRLQTQPDNEDIRNLKQVIVRFDRQRLAGALRQDQLAMYGGDGRIGLIAPTFSSIPDALVGTQMIAVIQRHLAAAFAKGFPLVFWDTPIEMPRSSNVVMYHPSRKNDQGLAWLLGVLRETVEQVAS